MRSAANVRAMREICGITQQQMADALGVRALAVKRWESGEREAPQDALDWLSEALREHDAAVAELVGGVVAQVPSGVECVLDYYRTQEQAEAVANGGECAPHQFLDAVARSAAERLTFLGYRVSFAYPDEERRYHYEVD